MRLVLFLGAGFSQSARFPLMREFSMFSQNLSGYEKNILCLHKCIEYAQRTRAFIHGDIYNVEYLMSVLSMAEIANPSRETRDSHLFFIPIFAFKLTPAKSVSYSFTIVGRSTIKNQQFFNPCFSASPV